MGENCPGILAVTYSSVWWWADGIIAPDPGDQCTKFNSGSSVSAPAAAGIVALALEANPSLTWRDVQHLVVRTSRTDFMQNNSDTHLPFSSWHVNGAGLTFSPWFGFGLMDAAALISAALDWEAVDDEEEEEFSFEIEG